MMREITFPASPSLRDLRAGDAVAVFGTVYTARDAAHKRLTEMLARGEDLPLELADQAIYYCGPCPAPPGAVIGSCGPTSALRMDAYAPVLYDRGVSAVLAKGPVSEEVRNAIVRNGAVYLCVTGGAGALAAACVAAVRPVAFEDLGTESIKELTIRGLPAIVGIDSQGRSLFGGDWRGGS